MAILRNRAEQFTVIPLAVLKESKLSMRARGLLCTMLSLPDGWEFSEKGLCNILPDGLASIKAGLKELENAGYLHRQRIHAEHGRFSGWQWDVFSSPRCDFPTTVKPTTVKPTTVNPHQSNINTNLVLKESSIKEREGAAPPPTPPQKKEPPTVEQVAAYCAERRNGIDAQLFCDYYASRGWGRVADWKAAVRTWEKRQKPGSFAGASGRWGNCIGPAPARPVTPEEQARRDEAFRENQRQLKKLLEEDERRRAAMEGAENT